MEPQTNRLYGTDMTDTAGRGGLPFALARHADTPIRSGSRRADTFLRLSAEAGVVIQIEHIEPGDHVIAVGGDFFYHFAEVLSAFII